MAGRGRVGAGGALGLAAVLVYAFLYAPILVLSALSFNASRLSGAWEGATLEWYVRAAQNPQVLSSLRNSLLVGGVVEHHNRELADAPFDRGFGGAAGCLRLEPRAGPLAELADRLGRHQDPLRAADQVGPPGPSCGGCFLECNTSNNHRSTAKEHRWTSDSRASARS